MIAERYRIVGLLGKGGMGEVYRADDLKLGAAVALKFLPSDMAHDRDLLDHFLNEVRLARQITHPNVCRVFDIGEVQGQHFLSMEYVDGENLAALLRRIGRLPSDKGVQIARQLCSGLAAAHERGVLHRDLKPANIMLDGRGQVRITDFGLARQTAAIHGAEARSGTPPYMAPEQLAGREVTARSDVYSLGLVLYELFTGTRVYQTNSIAELLQLHDRSTPLHPSHHVPELDPRVERLIMRCLEKDPRRRPASVSAVAAALPGGDPLAAALAAGETPSPELVAQAGEEGTISPTTAGLLFTLMLLGLLGMAVLSKNSLFRRLPLEHSPQQLTYQARRIIADLGYTEPVADSDYQLFVDSSLVSYIQQHDQSSTRWERLSENRPAAMYLWYVQSPGLLLPFPPGFVVPSNPPLTTPGMVSVWLDMQGRLIAMRSVPDRTATVNTPPEADWTSLFEAAGLDPQQFSPATPLWTPPQYADQRAAWTGSYPERPDWPLRIEAAAFQGRPVYFQMVGPWMQPLRRAGGAVQQSLKSYLPFLLPVLALVGGGWLARRNWRRGRVDRRGAWRLAAYVCCLHIGNWLFSTHHAPLLPSEMPLFWHGLGYACYWSLIVWVAYLAIEPHIRRRWPWRIISWNRLLAGRFQDPLVGKHLLIGAAVGTLTSLLIAVQHEIPGWAGWPPYLATFATYSLDSIVDTLLQVQLTAIRECLVFLVVFLLMVIILRKEWLATGLLMLLAMLYYGDQAALYAMLEAVFVAIIVLVYVLVFRRLGILPMAVGLTYHWIGVVTPITTDFSTWYAFSAALPMLLMAGLALYGLVISVDTQGWAGDEL